MAVITISREFGCGGELIAAMVAEKSGFLLVNKETITKGMETYGLGSLTPSLLEKAGEEGREKEGEEARRYIEAMHDYIYDLAIREHLIILGRGGSILFRDYPPALHVRLIASFTSRVQQVVRRYGLNTETGVKLVKEQDNDKRLYYRRVFDTNWTNLRPYHLVLNTEEMGLEDVADIIIHAYRVHAEPRQLRDAGPVSYLEDRFPPLNGEEEEESFMHPSEEEFARMLDFYRIRWEYEPRTFLLEWDSEGNVTEAFSPDFYLPDQELFIELTTQKPKQAWKKNRKIRRMRELYPEVRVRLIDKKGFESLLRKHSINEGEDETT